MRLVQLRSSNFRCFKEEVVVDLGELTVLIGKNDSGKSSLFDALEIFFNGVPEKDDVCVHGSDTKVSISCVFDRTLRDNPFRGRNRLKMNGFPLLHA